MSVRLITLAIHTYDRAVEVKDVFEKEGIHVELHNVNLDNPEVTAGVRIRINETDLPKALLIVENFEIFRDSSRAEGKPKQILVPIDFSDRTMLAVATAMNIAAKIKTEVVFLHACMLPASSNSVQLSDAYDFEAKNAEAKKRILIDAEAKMKRFLNDVKSGIKDGTLAPIKFSYIISEGIPEEVILAYAKRTTPAMVVMTTREAQKKESDLIGSVSAEVLDGSRVPVITIPETMSADHLNNISHLALICNLDQEDLLALDRLYHLLADRNVHISLVNVPPRRLRAFPTPEAAEKLLEYCQCRYPKFSFSMETVSTHNVDEYLNIMGKTRPFQMLCLSNKRKNMVSRIFNPSLAHKLLFRTDIPMMMLTV